MKMSQISINKIYMDKYAPEQGSYEFTLDCGAVYFDAFYDGEGNLAAIDQYFFTEEYSRDDLDESDELINIDDHDFPAKTYLLTQEVDGNEWLRFHAVVKQEINPDYFFGKYIGD